MTGRASIVVTMLGFLALVGLLALGGGCAKDIPDPGGETIDFNSPKSVVSHIFWAARTGNSDKLSTLCAADGSGSHAVKRVCAVTTESADWPSFAANFARAKLNGEPRIAGDSAVIKFLYGPEGAQPDIMKLKRVDGRWHIESF